MSQFPLAARVVEVIADLGERRTPRYRNASGCLVAGQTVLTAAHVLDGAVRVIVRGPDGGADEAAGSDDDVLADADSDVDGEADEDRLGDADAVGEWDACAEEGGGGRRGMKTRSPTEMRPGTMTMLRSPTRTRSGRQTRRHAQRRTGREAASAGRGSRRWGSQARRGLTRGGRTCPPKTVMATPAIAAATRKPASHASASGRHKRRRGRFLPLARRVRRPFARSFRRGSPAAARAAQHERRGHAASLNSWPSARRLAPTSQ